MDSRVRARAELVSLDEVAGGWWQGGFKGSARQVAAGMPRMRFLGADDLVEMILNHRADLADESKEALRLRRVWVPDKAYAGGVAALCRCSGFPPLIRVFVRSRRWRVCGSHRVLCCPGVAHLIEELGVTDAGVEQMHVGPQREPGSAWPSHSATCLTLQPPQRAAKRRCGGSMWKLTHSIPTPSLAGFSTRSRTLPGISGVPALDGNTGALGPL